MLPEIRCAFLFMLIWMSFQENEAPVVKIVAPAEGSSYTWDKQLRYEITVSDKEDGDTRYNEINTKEVLLEARVINDESAQAGIVSRKPLQAMMASNCMQCHDFNSKLIGPSFYSISDKYTEQDFTSLVKHVREGSKGVWGDIVMPTHPELTEEETGEMVNWILGYAKGKNVSYYIGTEGFIRIKKPESTAKNSSIILIATYLDHGKKSGQETRRLRIENGR